MIIFDTSRQIKELMQEFINLQKECLAQINAMPSDGCACSINHYCQQHGCNKGDCSECLHHIQRGCPSFHYCCERITYCYVLRFFNRFASEITHFINRYNFSRITSLNVVSLGCGPGSELYGIIKSLRSRQYRTQINYKGYDMNNIWRRQPGDSTALSTLHSFIKEYDNPMDSTIGASYVSLDANDTTKLEFCYDGNIRALPYHENKKLAIDDFTFRPLPFRLVSPPFFNHAKNIIRYALTTKDHIVTELKDEGDNYYFKLVIDENQQVEFFGKAYHMPLPPFDIGSTTSIYELWINKSNDLPYKKRREMSHDISVSTCSNLAINRHTIYDFNASDYFPKDYEIVKYSDLYKKKAEPTASSLIGKKAPGWILENIEAQPVSLADYKSKIILINFTGIGCGACQAAIPFLKQLKDSFTSEEFELIAIESWSRKVSAIRNYAKRKELNYTILNATNEVIKQYQTGGAAPYFFIVDQERIIRKVIRGYSNENTDKEIINAIKELL